MTNSDKLWNKAFSLEEQAETLLQSDNSYSASIKCSALLQEAGELREKAMRLTQK